MVVSETPSRSAIRDKEQNQQKTTQKLTKRNGEESYLFSHGGGIGRKMLQRRALESPHTKTLITPLTRVSRVNAAFLEISSSGLFILGLLEIVFEKQIN